MILKNSPADFTRCRAPFLFVRAFPNMACPVIWGEPSRLLDTGGPMMALVLVSGIIAVAGANSNYYASIKRIGLARSANLALIQPFAATVASFHVFGEILAILQWVFGFVLLAGCALTISIREHQQKLTGIPAAKKPPAA
ncbi:MAG: DMT family transporter [Candidatus Glassbacteria bacterium]|nr:DMT family transporter [Candidatus Glassbacteria bacterium]